MTTSRRTLVLHGLRLSSLATEDQLALRWALPVDEVVADLRWAEGEGLVRHRSGRLQGWSLTGQGRTEGERLLAAELDAGGHRPALRGAYERFMTMNQAFLTLCTDWQLRPGDDPRPNDHSDAAYDAVILERLDDLHGGVLEVVAVASVLQRFTGYRSRFEHALSRVRTNDVDWFTKPVIDSYHTIWFELHEDLLATLGLTRGEAHVEPAAGSQS